MRRISLWVMSTLSVLVLLFNYHTSLNSAVSAATTASTTRVPVVSGQLTVPAGADPPTGTSTTREATPVPSPSTVVGVAPATTVDGQTVMTRYGPVQVRITVADGRITAATVLQAPTENQHDQMINSRAVPIYNGEVIQAQSAQIDVVSGATVTWGGYAESLQSALDQAHL